MIDFIVKYWIEFLFGLIISGMGVMAKLMYNQHLKNKAIDKGVEALLRNGIVQTYNKWSERGYCPIYARENATRMYEPYHILGGNDVATDLIEDLKGLPTEPQKKKERRRRKEKKKKVSLNTYAKVATTAVLAHGMILTSCSYILSWIGMDPVVDVSSTIVKEIVAPLVVYLGTNTIKEQTQFFSTNQQHRHKQRRNHTQSL